MITDKERREVAASLRASANVGGARTLKRELAKALGIQLDRYTPEGSHTKILRGLADLIDRPTCKIILARELRTAYGKQITGINGYVLSCGHQAVGFEKPDYCPKCGAAIHNG